MLEEIWQLGLKIPNFCSKGLSLGLAISSVDFFCRFLSTLETLQLRAFLKPLLLIVILLAEGSQVFLRGAFSFETDSVIPVKPGMRIHHHWRYLPEQLNMQMKIMPTLVKTVY
jgi:uncharacterized membrane protein YfhO